MLHFGERRRVGTSTEFRYLAQLLYLYYDDAILFKKK